MIAKIISAKHSLLTTTKILYRRKIVSFKKKVMLDGSLSWIIYLQCPNGKIIKTKGSHLFNGKAKILSISNNEFKVQFPASHNKAISTGLRYPKCQFK